MRGGRAVTTDTSDSVFPETIRSGGESVTRGGMTLRQWYAGQALPACIAIVNADFDAGKMRGCTPFDIVTTATRSAFQIADAMIEAGKS